MIQYIGMLHLLGMMIENLYGWMTPKHTLFDRLYMMTFVSIPFSWIVCKDECIVSYAMKKLENKEYILGSEPENAKDIRDLFTNENQYVVFNLVNSLVRIGSVIMVNRRTTHIKDVIVVPTCIFYYIYVLDITCKLNYRKMVYPYFHVLFVSYLFATFSHLYR